MIQINEATLLKLLKAQYKLQLLEDAGVDNWDSYSEALNPTNGMSYIDFCDMNDEELLKPYSNAEESNNG